MTTLALRVTLAIWVALFVGMTWLLSANPSHRTHALSLLISGAVVLAISLVFAAASPADSPPELRTLRVFAVVLPSGFVLSMVGVHDILELHHFFSEPGEHIALGAVLSFSTVPFAMYMFSTFARLRDELARRAQHLQALHEISLSVAGEPLLSRLHEVIASSARRVVDSDRAVLLLPAERGREEVLLFAPPVSDDRLRDLARTVAASGEVTRTAAEARSLLAVPIRLGARATGAIGVARDAGSGFDEEAQLLLDMFGVAAGAGLENAARLEEAQVLATAEERERISRDLHDDLGQLLGFLTAKIQAAEVLVATGRGERAQEELAGLERATRMLSAQVRESILALRVRVGPNHPVGLALAEYVADFGIQTALHASFEGVRDAADGLPSPSQYHLLRIAQEALSNARRHAGAQRVVVTLGVTGGVLELSIADDGAGFTPVPDGPGFGLKTMAERARALGAEFQVRSTSGAGTRVLVRVPVAR